jgi:hypothetical protein
MDKAETAFSFSFLLTPDSWLLTSAFGSRYRDLFREVHVLNRVQERSAFAHRALEGFAA